MAPTKLPKLGLLHTCISVGVAPVRLLGHPLYYKPLLVGLSLMLFQQVTGSGAVMYESSKILDQAGVTKWQDDIVGVFRLVMTLIAAVNIDTWGRRPLLLVGATGIVISLTALAVTQWTALVVVFPSVALAWMSFLAMLLFLACFQLSFGPISWLYCGEIFPLAVRGPAIAAADIAGCFSSLAVKMLLPLLHRTVGSLGTYIVFVVLSLVSVLGVYNLVPETKGMTLEEIELFWGGDDMPHFDSTSLSEWLPDE